VCSRSPRFPSLKELHLDAILLDEQSEPNGPTKDVMACRNHAWYFPGIIYP
jgi:hypothetical protein